MSAPLIDKYLRLVHNLNLGQKIWPPSPTIAISPPHIFDTQDFVSGEQGAFSVIPIHGHLQLLQLIDRIVRIGDPSLNVVPLWWIYQKLSSVT